MAETSTKPYLIRAIHEWCSDNGFTPYIAVAVDSRTRVPREFVRNGEIVLNVSMMATHRLKLAHRNGAGGLEICRARAAIMDQLIRSLWAATLGSLTPQAGKSSTETIDV